MANSGENSGDAHVPTLEDQYLYSRTCISRIAQGASYKGQATVTTPADLRLVHVNKNLRMS